MSRQMVRGSVGKAATAGAFVAVTLCGIVFGAGFTAELELVAAASGAAIGLAVAWRLG